MPPSTCCTASSIRAFAMSEPTRAGGSRRWRRARRHVTFAIGLAITVMLVLTAALSLTYTPRDPLEMSMDGRLQGPSRAHPFGTDQFGRDLLSRVMIGSVTSILVGVIAVGIGMGLGVLLGMLSGYFGGWLDEVFMRLMDAVQGFPAILSALLITAVFRPSVAMTMISIGVSFLPVFVLLTRASFLELSDDEFVLAARLLGARDERSRQRKKRRPLRAESAASCRRHCPGHASRGGCDFRVPASRSRASRPHAASHRGFLLPHHPVDHHGAGPSPVGGRAPQAPRLHRHREGSPQSPRARLLAHPALE